MGITDEQYKAAARKAYEAGDIATARKLLGRVTGQKPDNMQAARDRIAAAKAGTLTVSPERQAQQSAIDNMAHPAQADIAALTDQGAALMTAGDDAAGRAKMTEANRLAIAAGLVPEPFTANPDTGGFIDLQNDPSMDMGKLASSGFGAMQGLGMNWGDEAMGGIANLLGDDGQYVTERAREMDRRAQKNQVSYFGGYVPGAIATALSAGKALGLGAPATMPGKIGAGMLLGGGQGAGAGAGAGETPEERMGGAQQGGLIGAGVGGAAPMVSKAIGAMIDKVRLTGALKAAGKGAPTTEELRAAGNAAYKAVDDAGVLIKPDEFSRTVGGIADDMRANGMWEGAGKSTLAPKSVALTDAMTDVATDPKYAGGVPFSVVDTMRKVAGSPAGEVTNRLESSLGMRAISGLDDFVNNLRPDQVIAGNADEIPGLVNTARSIWSKMLKSGLIDDAVEKSKNYSSGEASGLAFRFKSILQNDKLARAFTEAEKVAMRRVINGTLPEKTLRYLGGGLGQVAATATGAATGGFAGGLVGGGIGMLARKGSEALAGKHADIVRALVANGGKAALPAISGSKKAMIESMLRGAAQPAFRD